MSSGDRTGPRDCLKDGHRLVVDEADSEVWCLDCAVVWSRKPKAEPIPAPRAEGETP